MSVYLIAKLHLKMEHARNPHAHKIIADMVPAFEAKGWKLISSFQPIAGDVKVVYRIWELEDANAAGIAIDDVLQRDESIAATAKELYSEILEGQEIEICTRTPFSPGA